MREAGAVRREHSRAAEECPSGRGMQNCCGTLRGDRTKRPIGPQPLEPRGDGRKEFEGEKRETGEKGGEEEELP